MGMYDTVRGKAICPGCHHQVEIEDQIKWTQNPLLRIYTVGDEIDAPDGYYTFGSQIRHTLQSKCPDCGYNITFGVKVEDGKLVLFNII